MGTQNPQFLQHAGKALARVLAPAGKRGCRSGRQFGHEPLHESEKSALWKKDNMALESALAADPDTLLENGCQGRK